MGKDCLAKYVLEEIYIQTDWGWEASFLPSSWLDGPQDHFLMEVYFSSFFVLEPWNHQNNPRGGKETMDLIEDTWRKN